MNLKVYVVNAFAEKKFGGNPAAVVVLRQWLSDELMQQIAAQHNLSETAFIVPQNEDYAIRWFTPAVEVDLCGHATLASAHVFFKHLGYDREKIIFHSKSGILQVTKIKDDKLQLDFPVNEPTPIPTPELIELGLKIKPLAVFISAFDYMVVLNNQAEVENLSPDFSQLKQLPARGTIVTAKGDETDFVSRGFFPQSGIDEDPVTGSAHTVMAPYWAKELGKPSLTAIQLSARRGYLDCEMKGNRVLISGHAHTYLTGEFFL